MRSNLQQINSFIIYRRLGRIDKPKFQFSVLVFQIGNIVLQLPCLSHSSQVRLFAAHASIGMWTRVTKHGAQTLHLSISRFCCCMLARIFVHVRFAFSCCRVHWVATFWNKLAPVACAPVVDADAYKPYFTHLWLATTAIMVSWRVCLLLKIALVLHLTQIDVEFFGGLFDETGHLILACDKFGEPCDKRVYCDKIASILSRTMSLKKQHQKWLLFICNTMTSETWQPHDGPDYKECRFNTYMQHFFAVIPEFFLCDFTAWMNETYMKRKNQNEFRCVLLWILLSIFC